MAIDARALTLKTSSETPSLFKNVSTRSGAHAYEHAYAQVLCCAFHPSLPLVASSGMDGVIQLYHPDLSTAASS